MAEVLPKDEFEVLPPGEFIYLIHICAFIVCRASKMQLVIYSFDRDNLLRLSSLIKLYQSQLNYCRLENKNQ